MICTFSLCFASLPSCKFQTFPLGSQWECVEGGAFPALQMPRLCDRSSDHLPSVFEVRNVTDGREWKLHIHPSRAVETTGWGRKVERYAFQLHSFECQSLSEFKAAVKVTTADERTPDSLYGELFLVLLVVILVAVCCVLDWNDRSSYGDSFLGGFFGAAAGSSRSKYHFE